METIVTAWTEEELMALPKDGFKHELIEGEIVVSPAGFNHEQIGLDLGSALRAHAKRHALGVVLGSSLGCWMSNGDLLSPDVSFIAKERLPGDRAAREKYFQGAPDLVVEILSPFDTMGKMRKKLAAYFASGCRLAWVLNPADKTAQIYRSPDAPRLLRPTEALDGEDVLPGFRLPLAELFAEPDFG